MAGLSRQYNNLQKIRIEILINKYNYKLYMVIQTKVKVKEWGNSLGLIIPSDIVNKENIVANEEITITISKKDSLEDFFGKAKIKKSAQELKDESRKGWE